jgi:hypothetical protein
MERINQENADLKFHENIHDTVLSVMSITGGGKSDLNLGFFNEPSGTEVSDDYSETLELSEGEIHHKLTSVVFRKIDDDRKDYGCC